MSRTAALSFALALIALPMAAVDAAADATAAPTLAEAAEPLPSPATAAADAVASCSPAAADLEWLGGFNFCHAETTCQLGGPISCDGFSQCQEQNQCWVWCDGYLRYCPGVSPQYCPEAPPEY